ncbi:LpxD N-terminal domain-containing protein, partial [Achromobacter xylosoxidans]
MPVLLDLARAPTLEALLSAANTQGMDWRISAPAGADPLRVRGIGTLASASGQEISFLANPKYQSQLAATQAGAVIVSADVAETLEAAGADRPRFAL